MSRQAEWLRAQLAELGRWNEDGRGRTARPERCPRCRTMILAGLDADVAGYPVRVDTAELDQLGQLAAILSGRYLCKLNRRFGNLARVQIDAWSPVSHTFKEGDIIVAEHKCGGIWP